MAPKTLNSCSPRRIGSAFLVLAALALGCASRAAAATPAAPSLSAVAAPRSSTPLELMSSVNWSGWVDTAPSSFTDVNATWIVPEPQCALSPSPSYAAFWVGLGGAGWESNALEQTGVDADCYDGVPNYYAWYETVPEPIVFVPLGVHAGDVISAHVNVVGTTAVYTLDNLTTGEDYSTQVSAPTPDVTSAEWIAEAPAHCPAGVTDFSTCTIQPLADFGQVDFSSATATSAGVTAPISKPDWDPEANEIITGSWENAIPTTLTAGGTAFSVRWRSPAPTPRVSPTPQAKPQPKPHPQARPKRVAAPKHRKHKR